MNIRFMIVGVLFLFAFALWSKYVDRKAVSDLDFATTVKIQERIDKSAHLRLADAVGTIMEGATFFASPGFSIIVIAVITIIKIIKDKHIRALSIPVLFALLVVAEIYGKSVVHHPSPPFFMIKNPTTIFPKYYINEQYSYPSGHAARAVFMALIIASAYQSVSVSKKTLILLSIVLLLYVGLVSVSRIYLGHHWFSDIIGGLFIGVAMGMLTYSFTRRGQKTPQFQK